MQVMPGLIWTCLIWTCHHHPPSFFAVYSTTAWDDAPNIYRGSGELWQLPVYPGDPLSLGPWGAGMIGSGFFHQNHVDFTSETWGIPYHSKPCFACGRWVVLWRPSFFVPRIWGSWMLRLDTDWIPRRRDSGERGIWICFQHVCVRRRQWTSWIIHVFDRFCTYVCIIYDYV